MFRQLLQGISARLPSQCAVCHSWPAQAVCEACVARFAQPQNRCSSCALALPAGVLASVSKCRTCLLHPPPMDACLAAVTYGYPWADLLTRFKFGQAPGWAASFALLMKSTPWVEPALEQADWVLPLPLSKQRLQARGFNQSLELARSLAPEKVKINLLLRVKDTPPQSLSDRAERLRNVQNAFAVEPLRQQELAQKRLVLVDDVMTSGASLLEAAKVLRAAGAAHITALVLARTE